MRHDRVPSPVPMDQRYCLRAYLAYARNMTHPVQCGGNLSRLYRSEMPRKTDEDAQKAHLEHNKTRIFFTFSHECCWLTCVVISAAFAATGGFATVFREIRNRHRRFIRQHVLPLPPSQKVIIDGVEKGSYSINSTMVKKRTIT